MNTAEGNPPIEKLVPHRMVVPNRRIMGISAMLLPFNSGGVDWPGFRSHLLRTAEAGLTPAVNMDTGYVNLLDDSTKNKVLEETRALLTGQSFVAGAFVADSPGSDLALEGYQREMDRIQALGGIPVIFPSYGLTSRPEPEILAAHAALSQACDRFIAFELGEMFVPFGKIYSLDLFSGLMSLPSCIGIKHSSLRRDLEWQRLALRDRQRPDFRIFTGNDLAIDMVQYGSDYLFGLSTFAPDLFARRDRMWEGGDPGFHSLNDVLQYLGFLAFRSPVPAYKHSAAMFLRLRGWIAEDRTHPESLQRPTSDYPLLADICRQLDIPVHLPLV
ncbi:MAG: dihydrodipicolinate synthase family protein [Gemmataceae bacterium]